MIAFEIDWTPTSGSKGIIAFEIDWTPAKRESCWTGKRESCWTGK
jgi:hypothetical protein